MKIVTFNIRCANDPDGHSVTERAPRLLKIIEECDPDIIGFQEMRPHWESLICPDYGDKYVIFNKYRDKSNAESSPILYKKDKFDEIDRGWFWYSKTPWVESLGDDAIYHCKRICQWVILRERASDKVFCYYNTHFGFGDDYQVESVKLIKETVDVIGGPAVITGDFNMRPTTPAYAEMVKHFADANMLLEQDDRVTFHGYGKKTEDCRIDYCFITPDTVEATKYRYLNQTFDGKYPSDHYGLYFELHIK